MSTSVIAKIWTAVGVASLFLSVNAVLQVQGSDIFLPSISYENAERYSAAVYGLATTAIPCFLLIRLARIFARRYGDGTWAGSLPIAFDLEVQTDHNIGKEFQIWFTLLFFALPLISRLLLLRKVLKSPVFEQSSKEVVVQGVMEHLGTVFPFSVIFGDDYSIGHWKEGVTYFPFYQSWLFVGIEVFLWLYLITLIGQVTRSRNRAKRNSR